MDKNFEDLNEIFCEEFCKEFDKFKKTRDRKYLCGIKDLVEVINGVNEMEMDAAIRSIAEDYGYDSSTGRFHDKHVGGMMEFIEMFNAAKGRSMGGRRRRDSRGRYMSMGPKPTVYNPPYPYPDDYPWEYPYMNDGRDKKMDRDKNRDRGRVNGSDMDDGMYMLRQQNGMPIMTPYNMGHDVPKKLTNEQYEDWMHNMRNVDGTDGGHWTKEQIEAEAKRAGIDIKKYGALPVTVCADMIYSDFADVAAKYGVSKPSFYINMAMAFLDDDDYEGSGGGLQKLATYYYEIAKADE